MRGSVEQEEFRQTHPEQAPGQGVRAVPHERGDEMIKQTFVPDHSVNQPLQGGAVSGVETQA
jgi:hypothetical protein